MWIQSIIYIPQSREVLRKVQKEGGILGRLKQAPPPLPPKKKNKKTTDLEIQKKTTNKHLNTKKHQTSPNVLKKRICYGDDFYFPSLSSFQEPSGRPDLPMSILQIANEVVKNQRPSTRLSLFLKKTTKHH